MSDRPGQRERDFISYTQTDRAWAEWIACDLEAADYATLLQVWDMQATCSGWTRSVMEADSE
jgi:hypothetical protein